MMKQDGSDTDKSGELVTEIYESVLRPDRYDRFMELWGDYIDQSVKQSKAADGDLNASRTDLVDPMIGEHFNRAFALFEKMGRSDQVRSSDPVQIVTTHHAPAFLFSTNGELLAQSPGASALFGRITRAAQLQPLLSPDSYRRAAAALERLRYSFSPLSSGVLALAQDSDNAQRRSTSFLVMRPVRNTNGARLLMLMSPSIRWIATSSARSPAGATLARSWRAWRPPNAPA